MLPKNALHQLTLNRASGALRRLEREIWTTRCSLKVEATSPRQEQVSLADAKDLPREPVRECSYWGRLFDQRWCRVVFEHPTDANSWFFWIDQGEATLYVENVPYFGLNVAHRRCRLPEGINEVWIQSSCIQSAIWHEDASPMKAGSLFERAYLAERNDTAWNAYQDLNCLFDLAMNTRKRENPQAPAAIRGAGLQPLVDSYSPAFRLMLRIMNDAVDTLDREGIEAFSAKIAEGYEELRLDKTFSKCVLTGHAHLDLVWIWPERMGELKAVNVFATANHLLKQYPEMRFAYSQPASYEAVERREPELYLSVQEQIARGAWQATGAMQVESDTMMACGEALARSFIMGQEGFQRIKGAPARLTWLPDVFGYAACLPQIMQQTGVDFFFTTKMTWNAINRFPYSSFIWRGHDGSEVLAHVTQETGYVSHMQVDRIIAPMHANQQADLFPEFLMPVGFGDGGGGVTDEMLERARRLDRLPGMPKIEWGQPETYFEELATVADHLPVHQGECYLEYHRGTYTTHSELKALFRKLERSMQIAEAASVLAGKSWEMEAAWKKLIFSQFHDYIPGSSVWDVYKEDLPELARIADQQVAMASAALGDEGEVCLFNPHALPFRGWHRTRSGDLHWVQLPPLSGLSLATAQKQAPDRPVIEGDIVSNGLSAFQIDTNGWIKRLGLKGEQIPQAGPLGQLILYPDKPSHYEAWDIDRSTLSLGEVCESAPEIRAFSEQNCAGFEVTRAIGSKSRAAISFYLEAGRPELQISIELDWQEPEHLLKLYFPTEYCGTHTRCGIPFGSVLRPQHPGKMESEAMWEIPFSRHLSIFDDGETRGISFLSEDKYGASVRSGCVGISLVRSPRVTGFDSLMAKAWPAHLSQYGEESPFSDIGEHHIRLAIAPYSIHLRREEQPAALADLLFTRPLEYRGDPIESPIKSIEGDPTIIPCWVKPASDDGMIIRFHEVAGQRGEFRVETVYNVKQSLTRLDETVFEPLEPGANIPYTPYQLLSIHLEPA
ncbi:MAG: glycoside hydrolase family 38 C-terminal domain-containing protein [Verrucomicrobiota bacterium]